MDAGVPPPPRTPRAASRVGRTVEPSAPAAPAAATRPFSISPQQQQIVTAVAIGTVVLLLFVLVTTFSKEQAKRGPRLRTIVNSAAQWSAIADQDESPVVRLMHVLYAQGNLNAARAIASDDDIEAACGFELDAFARTLQQQQAACIRAMASACPSFRIPQGLASTMAGWTTTH
jgi:hypothetical protein